MNEEKWKKYIAYRGLLLFYHRGKGPLGGTLVIFFGVFWDVMGNPMSGAEKHHRSFDDRKNMGQTAQFVHQNEW